MKNSNKKKTWQSIIFLPEQELILKKSKEAVSLENSHCFFVSKIIFMEEVNEID